MKKATPKNVAGSVMSEEKSWMAENDLRTLIEAEKIKADTERLKAAMKKKREMQADLKKIEG